MIPVPRKSAERAEPDETKVALILPFMQQDLHYRS